MLAAGRKEDNLRSVYVYLLPCQNIRHEQLVCRAVQCLQLKQYNHSKQMDLLSVQVSIGITLAF